MWYHLHPFKMFINKTKCLYFNLLMDDETFMITSDVDDIIVRKERRTNKKENRKRKKIS